MDPEGGCSGVAAVGVESATGQGKATSADQGAEARVRMSKTELEKCVALSDYLGAPVLQTQMQDTPRAVEHRMSCAITRQGTRV